MNQALPAPIHKKNDDTDSRIVPECPFCLIEVIVNREQMQNSIADHLCYSNNNGIVNIKKLFTIQ